MWQSVSASKTSQINSGSAATPITPPSNAKADPPPTPTHNPAVQLCFSEYQKALAAAGGPKATGARDAAENAFRHALPDITDRQSVANFIACIAKGIVLRIFWQQEGPRLIFAAKAAQAGFPPESNPMPQAFRRPPGRPRKDGSSRY
jgi:hypothetical protein